MSKKRKHLGDNGSTGILSEERLDKFHPRIEALGALDEASASLGLARALTRLPETAEMLEMQRELYTIMAETASSPKNVARIQGFDQSRMDWWEARATDMEKKVSLPNEFILPGGSPAGAALSMARTIIRRAERRVALLLSRLEITNPLILACLNRFSHICYLLELAEISAGGSDPILAKRK
jgi:cob(I)alamin adenosyltransferase